MKLKVCGMKSNILEVAQLHPDYLGFILWDGSARHFEGEIPVLPEGIKKTGVFVNAPLDEVMSKIERYGLQAVQLHGAETAEYCAQLGDALGKTKKEVDIVKVFSIKDRFDFGQLRPFEPHCDYYLFDTKGKLPGGNGYTFDWKVLADYPSQKPFFLSGGIGLKSIGALKTFLQSPAARHCHAIDVNSRFENAPGLKDVDKLKQFVLDMGLEI